MLIEKATLEYPQKYGRPLDSKNSINEINQMNQTDQINEMNEMNQIPLDFSGFSVKIKEMRFYL